MADISYTIDGENGAFLSALSECKAAANEAGESISHSIESIAGAFERVNAVMLAVTAVLAGGAAFKEAIDATVELATGASSLGRQFGIGATAASELRVALDDAHVSTETLQQAGNALVKTLNSNEQAFTGVGIATRDSNGDFRNQLDIMLDATTYLSKLEEGTNRNIEGQRLFGKAWAEVSPVVKLTAEGMREAAEKAAALGLTVGTEQLSAVSKYRAAMNDVGDVMTAVKNVIGQAVMPALTAMGEWFGSIGPGVVEGFRIALATLAVPFRLIALGLEVIYETGKAVFTQLATYATTFATMFNKALHGDFSGAAASWRDGMGQIEKIGSDYWNKIARDAQATQDKITNSFAEAILGPKVTPATSGGGGKAEEDMKKQMELLREQIKLEDQHAQLRIKQIEFGLEESDRMLSGEAATQAAAKHGIELTKEQIALDDKAAQTRLKGIETGLTESDRLLAKSKTDASQFEKTWGGAFRTFQNAFSSAVDNMLRGGQSFGQAMRGVFASIAEAALQTAVKNIATMVMQSLFSDSIRSNEIKKDAGAAAAGAYKAVVGIPYVGPFLAPAAAAVAYAGVLAFESAEGGYDIPAGVNPLVQTHQREMILPQEHADTIRSLGKGRGGGGAKIQFVPVGNNHGLVSMSGLRDALRSLGHQFKLP
jgi:hypothetical protein